MLGLVVLPHALDKGALVHRTRSGLRKAIYI